MATKKKTTTNKQKKGAKTYDRFVEQPNLMRNVKRAPNLSKVKASK